MQAVTDLVRAQYDMDRCAFTATITATTLYPLDLSDTELSAWRTQTMDPSNNPEWTEAITRRDRCLEVLGWTLEEWEQRLEDTKDRTQ